MFMNSIQKSNNLRNNCTAFDWTYIIGIVGKLNRYTYINEHNIASIIIKHQINIRKHLL